MKNTQKMNFKDQMIEINHLQFRIRRHGKGKPILALHGFAQNAESWDRLSIDGYEVFALDLIGHGKSDKPIDQEPYQLNAILDQIHQIIHQFFKDRSFILLGYSMGGRIALNYVETYGSNSVDDLIIESSSLGISDEKRRLKRRTSDEKLASEIENKGTTWFSEFWGGLPIFASQKNLDQSLKNALHKQRIENSPHALALTLRSTGQGQIPAIKNERLKMQEKMLYLAGALDLKYTKLARTHFKDVSVIVSGVGHNIHLEAPVEYNRLIKAHLEKEKYENQAHLDSSN